ncbi:MAG: CDP-glycerol glycerophosphotransferase family protein [Ignavibacteriaceae bacterium]
MNQTTIMHQISTYLDEHGCYFTPYYADGVIKQLSEMGFLNFTILGGGFKRETTKYLLANNLNIDFMGELFNYDLVYTCSDLIVPKNILGKKIILVQEGMTDPENFIYHLVKKFKLPRYLASTSTTGLSDTYDYFCVASEGYKDLFISKGVIEEKLVVTGIPNFDNCVQYCNNNFPYSNYVLVATSDSRETLKYENRKKFIKDAIGIAAGRQLIFKLHPNEKFKRANEEIKSLLPDTLVFSKGNTNEMIANSDVLITKYSSVVYIGLALGKEVYSYFDLKLLKKLLPVQNNGMSAFNIAEVGKNLLENKKFYVAQTKKPKLKSGVNFINRLSKNIERQIL